MKEVILNMKEENKYKIIKKLVNTKGDKTRASVKLCITERQINRLIIEYKKHVKAAFIC